MPVRQTKRVNRFRRVRRFNRIRRFSTHPEYKVVTRQGDGGSRGGLEHARQGPLVEPTDALVPGNIPQTPEKRARHVFRHPLPVRHGPGQTGHLEPLLGDVQRVRAQLGDRPRRQAAEKVPHRLSVVTIAISPVSSIDGVQKRLVEPKLQRRIRHNLQDGHPHPSIQPLDPALFAYPVDRIAHPLIHLGLPLRRQRRPQQVERIARHRPGRPRDGPAAERLQRMPQHAHMPRSTLHTIQRHELHRRVRHSQQLPRHRPPPQPTYPLLLQYRHERLPQRRILAMQLMILLQHSRTSLSNRLKLHLKPDLHHVERPDDEPRHGSRHRPGDPRVERRRSIRRRG